jgi:hypothetical protein
MDSGEVIPGLNEGWTFLGAKLMEWVSGMMAVMIVVTIFELNINSHFPIVVGTLLGTVYGLSSVRKLFPDEEKGLANTVMSSLGFAPPKIPKPATIQPYWSGAPIKTLPEKKEYVELGIREMLRFKPEQPDQTNF